VTNEIDETSTEEALHEADADEAQAAARRHRRPRAFISKLATDEEGRTSETDPQEKALHQADPDETQAAAGHHRRISG